MISSATKTIENPALEDKRALLAARLQKAARKSRQAPLSFAQQRLWFLDQLEPNSPLYNIGAVAQVAGALDAQKLQQCFEEIVIRHETLRTRFSCPDEAPVQVIDPDRRFKFGVVDLATLDPKERSAQADRLVRAELNRPFDLSSEHPIRATLIQLSRGEQRLVLILHHIIADEWSLKVLFKELAELYAGFMTGRPAVLPELPIQYSDYARWQRQWLQGETLERQLNYWKAQLADYPPVTELPTDHPRSQVPTFKGKTVTRALGADLTAAIQALAKGHEATLFMVLLAAYQTLIHRYTQQDDLIVCAPVAGRNRVEIEKLIGFFVNTLALRTKIPGDLSFSEVLARVKQVTLGAMANQDLPFERLVEELQPERTLSHLPFTRLMFSFQAAGTELLELPGATLRFIDVASELAKFDQTLVLRETSEGLLATVEYNRDLFEPETISRFLGHFETLLQGIVNDPKRAVAELPLITAAERRQIVVDWNDTSRAYPRDRCIHELFEAQAAATPDAVASVWGHQTVTYGELNFRANQLARFLGQFGIKPDVPVGLCVARSPEMLVGMLGILKAGGAYVPLDANYPKDRLAFMLEDAQAPVIITQQSLLGRIPRDRAKVVCLDADWELIGREPRDNTASLAGSRNLAYVMYTSGSTGQPKGVAVSHRAVNRLVLNNEFIKLGSADRIAQVSNISFDAATFEIWGALLNGAQLVGITRDVALSPKDFATELRQQGITAMFLTAALFNQLAGEAPGAFEMLRTLIAGGEALDPKWVRAVLRDRPPQELVNGYGPTENTTFTCCYRIRELPENTNNVPIGRPISNTTAYILDRCLNPVPIGVPGELYTGGDGLARGYWRRSQLTAEKFVQNPFDSDPASKLYKTGDLARFLPDGTIEFLGRIDDQVKVRGFRIELGEIETVLSKHPGIRECVVAVYGSSATEKRLLAYVVAAAEPLPNASELRTFLRKQLPDYMLPSAFVTIERLPLTPNGKVDRKALPPPDQTRPTLDRNYVAPRDSTESQLVGIWETVLGVRPVGIQDKFFDLGGHSMLAVKVIAQIEKVFGRKLRLATIFQAPAIEKLAQVLREEIKETTVTNGSSLVEVQSAGSRPPLFLVHGAGGGMFWGYINLSRSLGPDQPVYGFKSRGLDGHEEWGTIEELAAQYVADLRKIQPRGPYYLGGYCFGGNVAYEMACQLADKGEKVALLALLNCAPPHSSYSRIPWTPAWCLRFARNLVYWSNYFRHWSGTQRREFFKWKWHLLRRRLSLANRGVKRDPSKIEPGDLVDLSSFTPDQKKIWETHIRALVKFRPKPYGGRVHLFRSPGHPLWCSFDDHYGWDELAMGGVTAIKVSGAHEKILEEPWVKELADHLGGVLLGAQESASEIQQGAHSKNASLETPVPKTEVECSPSRLQHLDYWKELLASVPDLLDLPADRPRPAKNPGADAREPICVSEELSKQVTSFAASQNCEPVDVFLASFAAVLQRYTGASQIVVGSDGAFCKNGTSRAPESDNVVALRCDFSPELTFRDLVRQVGRRRSEAVAYSDVRFEEILSALGRNQSDSYAPIFQVFLAMDHQEPVVSANRSNGIFIEINPQVKNCDVAIRLRRDQTGYSGEVRFSSALFEPSRLVRLTEHFQTVLKSGIAQPERLVTQLDLLSAQETRTLLVDWTATEWDYAREKTLPDLFCEQAMRTPDLEALVCSGNRLTYRQLHQHALYLATRLREAGVVPESLVGICLERSAEMVVAILGTLLAGGAYVPLDPKYPKDRLAFTLQDANVKVLLTSSALRRLLPPLQTNLLLLDKLSDFDSVAAPEQPRAKPEHLAYVIYTSGSTGKPKGVALEHRNAVEMVCWAKGLFGPEELGGVLFSTSICFDLSVFELFVPLCSGGKVILVDNALSLEGLPESNEVRLINTVPSAIRELLRMRAVPETVRVINLAGEPLSAVLVDQIYRETSVDKVYDFYGPTETTTYSTGGLREPGKPATIGRPLANEQVYLLDSLLRLVPIGNPGELFIGGHGVARGYLNRSELTGEKFIPHPFKPGARLYRTGDLARWRPDGKLEYLGRIDHQVKIRGFRIELGEIESVLKSHSAVASSVVIAREYEPGDKRLVAYVVTHASQTVTVEGLKGRIRSQLPEFMIPSDFVFLEEMPLTPNGKIDRKALPVPGALSEQPRTDLVAPRTDVEQQLTAIWSEVLGLEHISVRDNFFELGGHSLLAVRVLSAIRNTFQVELPISRLFSTPTIESLAEVVICKRKADGQPVAPPITKVPRAGNLPVSYVQERLWFLDQLEPGSSAYNVPVALRLKGKLDVPALTRAVNTVIERHETLRSTLICRDGLVVQTIADKLILEIPLIDLEPESAEHREARALALLKQGASRPFDLSAAPLMRMTLLRLQPNEHLLLLVMHHSISDGWSLALFLQEVADYYNARTRNQEPPTLCELPIQYVDFAQWQRCHMAGPLLDTELKHWKGVLAGAPAEIALPLDHARPERPTGRAGIQTARLGREVAEKLKVFATRQGCTPFMIFLAALMIAFRRWTGQQDLVIGTVVAGRTRREVENIIGCFMNFLPLRGQVDDGQTANAVLAAVRTAVLDAQTHQDCPFEKIVEAVNPQRRHDQNPLYNAALLLQNFPENVFPTDTLASSRIQISQDAPLLDLRFEIEQADEDLSLCCEYKRDLFEAATIERFLAAWVKAIQALVHSPEAKVAEIELGLAAAVARSTAPASPAPDETIVIAATFTSEPIAEPLQFWLNRLNLPAQIEFAPYNQVFQQLLDPASLLARNGRGLNVVLGRVEDWQGSGRPLSEGPTKALTGVATEFVEAVKAAAARSSVPLLICLCPPSLRKERNGPDGEQAGLVENELEKQLASISGVYVLSFAEINQWYPVAEYYDSAGEQLGAVPYTAAFFTALGTALARKYHAFNRPAYKVIAIDCDNTLWAGVCGEEGPNGIQLDESHQALQEFMLRQRDSGMLLCLCSKNNEEDVNAVFAARKDFPLQPTHLAASRLNWLPKSANLKALARELNVGLESFIFVDDNPVECAEVNANCPEVLALQLPEDPVQIPQFLAHCWVFDHLRVTSEDRKRAELYQQNRLREQLRTEAPTLQDFLVSLELKIEIQPIAPDDWARVSQLTQRTNQFNTTTRRLTENDLKSYLAAGEGVTVRVRDRFGDYGLVGVALYRRSGEGLLVESLMLSCRVLGRGVEHQVIVSVAGKARQESLKWVDVKFTPSPKNKPALDFLETTCGQFKQPLNGGSVFRVPVDVASKISLQAGEQPSVLASTTARDSSGAKPVMTARFDLCRRIALETNDVGKIQAEISGNTGVRTRREGNFVAPRTQLERDLCKLWRHLLHVEPVGVTDDFFALGGHSLLAVRLFAEIEKLTGHKLPLVTVFQAPTVRQLVEVLSKNGGAGSFLVPIQPKGTKYPLFLVHGAGGDVLWGYANLAAHLPADQPIYGLRSHGQQGLEEMKDLEQMARSYVEVVRSRQPHGPYYLGGYCFGGNVAYEMARQLRFAGEEVALVVLLDSAPANAGYEVVTWWRPSFAWRFVRNFRYWLSDFMALPGEDRRRLLTRKTRAIGRKLKYRFGLINGPERFNIEEVIDPRHFPENELKLWQVHLEALIAHVERPYSGRVALLRTLGQPLFCSLQDDFCWGKLVRGCFTVQCIPGSHENIFMEPNVRVLGAELVRLLQETDAEPASESSREPIHVCSEASIRL